MECKIDPPAREEGEYHDDFRYESTEPVVKTSGTYLVKLCTDEDLHLIISDDDYAIHGMTWMIVEDCEDPRRMFRILTYKDIPGYEVEEAWLDEDPAVECYIQLYDDTSREVRQGMRLLQAAPLPSKPAKPARSA